MKEKCTLVKADLSDYIIHSTKPWSHAAWEESWELARKLNDTLGRKQWCGEPITVYTIEQDKCEPSHTSHDCVVNKIIYVVERNEENVVFAHRKDGAYPYDYYVEDHVVKTMSDNKTPLYELEICEENKKYRVLNRYEEVKDL